MTSPVPCSQHSRRLDEAQAMPPYVEGEHIASLGATGHAAEGARIERTRRLGRVSSWNGQTADFHSPPPGSFKPCSR